MLDIKNCIVCGKEIKREDYKIDYWFQMVKYCSKECGDIFTLFKRKFPKYKFELAYAKGLLGEYFVKNKLEKDGWNVFITKNSRSIFDLIAFKNNEVKCIQVTTNIKSKDRKNMIENINKFKESNNKINIQILTPNKKGDYVEIKKIK